MKRNIISAIIMGVVFFSTPVYADYTISARVVTDLNVRQYPNKDAEIIDVLPEGKQIKVSESSKPNWNKVELNGYDGYVYNAYLLAEEDDSIAIPTTETEAETNESIDTTSEKIYTKEEFIHYGIINWNGWNWTYYLMSMFPGSTSTPCPGRWVNDDGFVCDPDGYIILASVDLPPYTVVETPFGYIGKVYDTGCPSGILDVYTNW